MKKIIALTAITSILLLSGCSGDKNSSDTENSSSEQSGFSEQSNQTVSSFSSSTESSSEPVESVAPPPYNPGKITLTATTPDGDIIEYTFDEESACAYGAVTYSAGYLPDSSITSTVMTASAERGKCLFGEYEGSAIADLTQQHKLTVVDEDGDRKDYTVITERTEAVLPMVYITLDEGKTVSDIQRHETIGMTVSIDCSKSEQFSDGLETVHGEIRGRGNSTWEWEKKPYKIKLDEKAEVLGLPAERDWVLIANYADKSLMRNIVAFDMARTLNFSFTPTQYPVDLFINGEYQGVYAIGEHLEVGSGRVDISQKKDGVGEWGFMLEVGGADSETYELGVDYFHTNSKMLKFITFKDPKADELTPEERQKIIDLFNEVDNLLVNGGSLEQLEQYIDVDSFVDWVILQELTNNTDSAFRRSCYFTVDAGEKIRMGPVWDFDLAFGNYVIDNYKYDSWTIVGSDEENSYIRTCWGNHLMQNEQFRARLSARWKEVRDKLLETGFDSIRRNAKLIYPSQEENFKVWDIWGQKAGYSSWSNNAANTYDLQIWYLNNFLTKRAEWIDENIDTPLPPEQSADENSQSDSPENSGNSDISDNSSASMPTTDDNPENTSSVIT